MRYFIRGLATALVALIIADVLALGLLWKVPALTRLEPVPPAAFDSIGRAEPLPEPADQASFAADLQDVDRPLTPESLLDWVMGQASVVGPGAPGNAGAPYSTLEYARSGGGVMCGDLALVYHNALAAAGFQSRVVQLWRTPFHALDTHVTTEVLLNGRWVIYDPTFDVSFRRDGRLLGAVEIHQALRAGMLDAIEPVFHQPIHHLAELEPGWYEYFTNVIISADESRGLLSRLPPFRYWWGPRVRYLATERPLWPVRAQQTIYSAAVVTLPLAILAVAVALALALLGRSLMRRD